MQQHRQVGNAVAHPCIRLACPSRALCSTRDMKTKLTLLLYYFFHAKPYYLKNTKHTE